MPNHFTPTDFQNYVARLEAQAAHLLQHAPITADARFALLDPVVKAAQDIKALTRSQKPNLGLIRDQASVLTHAVRSLRHDLKPLVKAYAPSAEVVHVKTRSEVLEDMLAEVRAIHEEAEHIRRQWASKAERGETWPFQNVLWACERFERDYADTERAHLRHAYEYMGQIRFALDDARVQRGIISLRLSPVQQWPKYGYTFSPAANGQVLVTTPKGASRMSQHEAAHVLSSLLTQVDNFKPGKQDERKPMRRRVA